jgi:membrane protease YdiL (CAAX protease family)
VRSEAASARVHPGLQATVAGAGLIALSGKDVGWDATAVITAVGVAAAVIPLNQLATAQTAPRRWMLSVLLGVVAFATVRSLFSTPLLPFGAAAAVGGSVAAIAEEAFFRRFLYGWLARWGTAIAVVGSALAFAAVHAPLYGAAALPIDLGAGLLFGWQRWATGGWTAPAATHVVANLLILR